MGIIDFVKDKKENFLMNEDLIILFDKYKDKKFTHQNVISYDRFLIGAVFMKTLLKKNYIRKLLHPRKIKTYKFNPSHINELSMKELQKELFFDKITNK